jgi:hypothetical protein
MTEQLQSSLQFTPAYLTVEAQQRVYMSQYICIVQLLLELADIAVTIPAYFLEVTSSNLSTDIGYFE